MIYSHNDMLISLSQQKLLIRHLRGPDFPPADSQYSFAVDSPVADVNHPRVDFRIGKMRMERDSVPAMMILEQGMMSNPVQAFGPAQDRIPVIFHPRAAYTVRRGISYSVIL